MIQFNKKRGLCGNLVCMFDSTVERAVLKEMLKQFTLTGLSDAYPFGRDDYWKHKDGTQHLCPERLSWAYEHFINPPQGQSDELTAFYAAWYEWAIAQAN